MLRDALRRQKKQESLGESGLRTAFDDQLAAEIDGRFADTGVDPADVIDIINNWEAEGDAAHQRHARILRLFFVVGMTMEEIQHDMGLTQATAYRRREQALKAVRVQLESNI